MAQASATSRVRYPAGACFLAAFAVLAGLLAFLFANSFRPELVLFSNDGPLGAISSDATREASTFSGLFTGYWQDLNWIGIEQPGPSPDISWAMYTVLGGPVGSAKFYGPSSLLILGLAAWLFFRQLGCRNTVAVLGGIAAALNMNTFSNACWGLPSRALTQACIFLALAALQSGTVRHFWIKAVLAGMAVGMAVMEGFDVGALYSLYVAAFAMFLVLIRAEPLPKKAARAACYVALVAICAGWIAAQTLSTLIGTQIKGVAGAAQDQATREKRWGEATYWSLPKIETLRVLIPGLFGYRMDSDEGGNYWGRVGEQPGLPRHSGSGEYAGVLVLLAAAWACANAFRKAGSGYTDAERKHILFWAVAALISVLLAWGRHAPFYKLVYALPWFSTIRNPIKFMHMFHLAAIILFGLGLEGLFRIYIDRTEGQAAGLKTALHHWWTDSTGLDRKWIFAAGGAGLVAVLGFLIYYSSSRDLNAFLHSAGFNEPQATQIAQFSYREYGFFLIFYLLSLLLIALIVSGYFAGPRWRLAVFCLGLILVTDLARADRHWIVYYDYKSKYLKLPVFETLEAGANEHRVTAKLSPFGGNYLVNMQDPNVAWFASLCNNWLQNQFQYYNIPSLDVVQMPRIPELDETFLNNFMPTKNGQNYLFARLWELTSTRLLLGQRDMINSLNSVAPGRYGFVLKTPVGIAPRESYKARKTLGEDDITTDSNPGSPFGLFEFTNALPRVKLFTAWQSMDQDDAVLARLRDLSFDPSRTVLVSGSPALPAPAANLASASTEFVRYSPKRFTIRTDSAAPGILVVNDKYAPEWKVFVDGKEDRLLRCNYIMRGVYLPAGNHTAEFRYHPSQTSLYITFSAISVAALLGLYLLLSRRRAAGI